MQRGVVGAANLNQILQEAINPVDKPGNGPGTYGHRNEPEETGLRRGGTIYRPADKVMQIKNNYDKEVFNGDIGQILSVDKRERELTVGFDGRQVTYDISELDELVLAYATTIHKSQGSEYPIVIHEPLHHAAEEPDLHRHHQGKEDSCSCGDKEGPALCHQECDGAETKYDIEGENL